MPSFLLFFTLLLSSLGFSEDFYDQQIRPVSCDLKNISPLPILQIVGESHGNEQSIDLRNVIIQDGAKGKYPVATEGYTKFGTTQASLKEKQLKSAEMFPSHRSQVTRIYGGQLENSKIHGIESNITHSLVKSFQAQSHIIFKGPDVEFFTNFLKDVENSPLSAVALTKVQSQRMNLSTKLQALAIRVEQALASPKQSREKQISALAKATSAKLIQSFVSEHHKALVSIVNTQYKNYFKNKLRPTLGKWSFYLNRNLYFGDGGQAQELLTLVRDRDFALRIGNLICQYHQTEKKIVITVGAGHMPGLRQHLKRMTGDKIVIEEYHSFFPGTYTINCRVRNICPDENIVPSTSQ